MSKILKFSEDGKKVVWADESITDVIIPEGVEEIAYKAFYFHCQLQSVQLPESLVKIGDYAFAYCRSLVSIKLPSKLVSIGKSAFRRCNHLESINLPNSLHKIGEDAFYDCSSLKSVHLLDCATIIGSCPLAFITGNVPQIDRNIVNGMELSEDRKKVVWADYSIIRAVIPEGVEEIGFGAFQNCHRLTEVQLPYSLKLISQQAFAATGLVSLQIPEGVTEIGFAAFFNSRSLRSISIPSTLEKMTDLFSGLELQEIYIYVRDLDKLKVEARFIDCDYLYVPSGMLEAYKQHPFFGKIEHIVEME